MVALDMQAVRWVTLPRRKRQAGGLERAREIAWKAAYDFSFHEVAIDDPFQAESRYRELGASILHEIGDPLTVRYHTYVEFDTASAQADASKAGDV